jgi:hypothetical protein
MEDVEEEANPPSPLMASNPALVIIIANSEFMITGRCASIVV